MGERVTLKQLEDAEWARYLREQAELRRAEMERQTIEREAVWVFLSCAISELADEYSLDPAELAAMTTKGQESVEWNWKDKTARVNYLELRVELREHEPVTIMVTNDSGRLRFGDWWAAGKTCPTLASALRVAAADYQKRKMYEQKELAREIFAGVCNG